jgi:molybdopterin molybdotransferase
MGSGSGRSSGENERVVSFDEALEMVLGEAAQVAHPAMETVGITEAMGRVLAVAVLADRDQPPFDRSTRDGFAVRIADLATGGWLSVAGQVQAGHVWDRPLVAGETIEIMTGAPVPEGADAVVMLEHVDRNDSRPARGIRLAEGRKIDAGANIVPRGSEAREGSAVLTAGAEVDAAAVALAAACGAAQLQVFALPSVSIVATGDELVDVAQVPGPQQIRNSNSYGLEALVADAGGRPLRQEVAPDRREELRQSILQARMADLMLLTGGVSMGEYDLVEEVLLEMGAEFFFTGVRMQPGKPVVFGRLPARDGMGAVYFFGLPGNPISTQVTFACFVEPLLRAMRGGVVEGPRFAQATLGEAVEGRPGLMRILPARLTARRVQPEVRLVAWQGSGDMAANARANCYAVLPPERESFNSGEVITIILR